MTSFQEMLMPLWFSRAGWCRRYRGAYPAGPHGTQGRAHHRRPHDATAQTSVEHLLQCLGPFQEGQGG
jgi:hypothetical protein